MATSRDYSALPRELVAGIYELELQKISILQNFIRNLESISGNYFHGILMMCKEKCLFHYTKLAEAVEVSVSQVHRWFQPIGETLEEEEKLKSKRSTPGVHTRVAAIRAVDTLLQAKRAAITEQLELW